MKIKWVKIAAWVISVAILGIFLFSGLVMLLWNSTLTPVLHIGAITIWQAAGILLLAKILLGGRRRGGMHKVYGHKKVHFHCYRTANLV